jgi:acetyl-CoA synthetase
MRDLSNRFANVLKRLGVQRSDRVCLFLSNRPEFYIAMVGCAKIGAIIVPLYSDYMSGAVTSRMRDARPRLIVTDSIRLGRILLQELADLEHVIVTEDTKVPEPRCLIWDREMAAVPDACEPLWLEPDTPFLMVYTSGDNGEPVGLVHVHEAMKGYLMTARWVLDIRDGDRVLTHGRAGWFLNIVYSAFAPWLCGVESVICPEIETAEQLYDVLAGNRVSVLYTIPSVYTLLTGCGPELAARYDLSRLRHLLSVLEPLTPAVFSAVLQLLKLTVCDTWWSAETGMITIAHVPCLPIKPGYLGKPVPGITAAILDDDDREIPYFEMGRLVLKGGWPAAARAIWGRDDFNTVYRGNAPWFMTGDFAFTDDEGYYFYQGRSDDVVITSAGKIGMSEIAALVQDYPAVAEAAVVRAAGVDRPKQINAFIVLHPGYTGDDALKQGISSYVADRLSADCAPASIEWCRSLPRDAAGAVRTVVLKAASLGLPAEIA